MNMKTQDPDDTIAPGGDGCNPVAHAGGFCCGSRHHRYRLSTWRRGRPTSPSRTADGLFVGLRLQCARRRSYAPAAITGTFCNTMQVPGPTLIVTEGETVTVTLTNNLPAAAGNTSILFPGFNVTTTGGVAGLLTQEAHQAIAIRRRTPRVTS